MTAAAVVEKMCTNKKSYTEMEAIHACIRSSVTFGKPFRYYHCPHCGKWHVTSRIKTSERVARAG